MAEKKNKTKSSGFTYTEAIIAVIIIAGMAAFALPKFYIQVKKIKNQEAVNILFSLYEAQKDYSREHPGPSPNYANDNSVLADYVSIPQPPELKNFSSIQAKNGLVHCDGPGILGEATPNFDASYKLIILEDARILCTDQTASSSPCAFIEICGKLGFPAY